MPTSRSVWGDQLNGADYNMQRTYGMTETVPPENSRWHHYKINIGQGNDSTVSPLTEETLANHRAERLAWLDQFQMEITEEGAFRWWKWYDGNRVCRWSERRPLSDPLPSVPGFFPSDK